jgi:hypothetical protein
VVVALTWKWCLISFLVLVSGGVLHLLAVAVAVAVASSCVLLTIDFNGGSNTPESTKIQGS